MVYLDKREILNHVISIGEVDLEVNNQRQIMFVMQLWDTIYIMSMPNA